MRNNTEVIIPKLKSKGRENEYKKYSYVQCNRVLYIYLFEGETNRWLDEYVLGLNPKKSKGFQSMGVLHYLGLSNQFKGIFKGVDILSGIKLLEKAGSEYDLLISSLRSYRNYQGEYDLNEIISDVSLEYESSQYKPGLEGREVEYILTKYERNNKNRLEAIKCHGSICKVCGFNFEVVYGQIGKSFIEIHHIVPLSQLETEITVNAETDLVPVCSNCHRMMHRKPDRVLSVQELKNIINLPK